MKHIIAFCSIVYSDISLISKKWSYMFPEGVDNDSIQGGNSDIADNLPELSHKKLPEQHEFQLNAHPAPGGLDGWIAIHIYCQSYGHYDS